MKKRLSFILALMMIFMSIMPAISFATSSEYGNEIINELINKKNYKLIKTLNDVAQDKIFEVYFSKTLNENSAKEGIRLLRESDSKFMDVDISFEKSSVAKVKPKEQLQREETYYLIVDNSIKSSDGNYTINSGTIARINTKYDATDFRLESVNFVSSYEIEARFNKNVDIQTAKDLLNYQIDGKSLPMGTFIKAEENKVNIILPSFLPLTQLNINIGVLRNIKDIDGSRLPKDYKVNVSVFNVGYSEKTIVLRGETNYRRQEVTGINLVQDNLKILNVNSSGDVYIKGNNCELENMNISGTLYLNPGALGEVNIKNVNVAKIVVLSGSDNTLNLFNVQSDELRVDAFTNVRVSINGNCNIYKTNVKLNHSFVKLVNDNVASFGRIQIDEKSAENKILELQGKFNKSIEVFKGVKILALTPETNVDRVISYVSTKDKVILEGSGPLNANFGVMDVKKQTAIEIRNALLGTLITNNLNLDKETVNATILQIVDRDPNDPDDVTPPVVSMNEQSVVNVANSEQPFKVIAQSNENGYLYLVNVVDQQQTLRDLNILIEAKKAKRVDVFSKNTNVEISAEGLIAGTYYVYAVDSSSNISKKSEKAVTILAGEKTEKPVIVGTIKENQGTIKGTAQPGAIISVKLATTEVGTQTADASGKFEITGMNFPKGTLLYFTAKLPGKLTSEVLEMKVEDALSVLNNFKDFTLVRAVTPEELYDGKIDNNNPATIRFNISEEIPVTGLRAKFTTEDSNAIVKKGQIVQVSDKMITDYTDALDSNPQRMFYSVTAASGDVKDFEIIIHQTSNNNFVTNLGVNDFVIGSSSISSGINHKIDTNLKVSEFLAGLKKHDKADWRVLKSDKTVKLDSDLLELGDILEVTSESGKIKPDKIDAKKEYTINVISPKKVVLYSSASKIQNGEAAIAGVNQESSYSISQRATRKGSIKLGEDIIYIEKLDSNNELLTDIKDKLTASNLANVWDLTVESLALKFKDKLDPNAHIPSILDLTVLDTVNTGIEFGSQVDSVQGMAPVAGKAQEVDVTVVGVATSAGKASIIASKNGVDEIISEFNITKDMDANTIIAGLANSADPSKWTPNISGSKINFKSKNLTDTDKNISTSNTSTGITITTSPKNGVDEVKGQKQKAKIPVRLSSSADELRKGSIEINNDASKVIEITKTNLTDARDEIKDKISNILTDWTITSDSEGLLFEAKTEKANVSNIISSFKELHTGLKLNPQTDIVTGIAKSEGKPIVYAVKIEGLRNENTNGTSVKVNINGSDVATISLDSKETINDIGNYIKEQLNLNANFNSNYIADYDSSLSTIKIQTKTNIADTTIQIKFENL